MRKLRNQLYLERRFAVLFLLCAGTLLVATHCVCASYLWACNATCDSVSCGASPKYQSDGSTFYGCKKKLLSAGCKGYCEQCTGGTVAYHCVRSTGAICSSDTGLPSTSCGVTTYYDCIGTPYPNCTCNTDNPYESTDNCSVKTCVAG